MRRRLLSSLRSRVFAALLVAAGLPLAIALGFAARRVSLQAEEDLQRGLREAARLVEEHHRGRLEIARERAALIADLPKLKAAVATGHPPTVEQVALDYRERVGSDAFVISGRDGSTLAALGTRGPFPGTPGEAVTEDGGRLLESVSVPIVLGAEAPEVLGRLTLAFALDAAFAARLRALTGSDVAVVRGGRVFASTVPAGAGADIAAAAAGTAVATLDVGGESYGALRAALGPGDGAPAAVVLRSRQEALRPLHTLRNALALAALAAAAVSVLLSWALARTVTRPLLALTDAMKEIARTGDLARGIGPGHAWDDEDARLVASTFGTLTASIARFQREGALRERLSALGRMSTVIAHEVRNPLMIIKGSLRGVRRDGASPQDVREAAADIDLQVKRLDRVVGDVLDFARPLRIEPSAVDLPALLADVAQAPDGGRPVAVRVAADPAAPSVRTDGARLRSVLVNLLENARESVEAAVPAADGPAPIEVGSRALAGGRVLLWVEDDGAGIAPADLPHLFEPYYTTRRTGTGLGLAIARRTIEALGGSIRLERREPAGARVEIELPAEPPATVEGGTA
jgi:signal transduction histidine kinase